MPTIEPGQPAPAFSLPDQTGTPHRLADYVGRPLVYMGIARTTYLIDAQGTVVRRWDNVKVEGHADQVLAAVAALSV